MRTRTAIVLFSGIGLSSYAIKDFFKIICAVEYWPYAVGVYKANFPNTNVIMKSIRSLNAATVCKTLNVLPGEVDLIQNSFVCTEISGTGKQRVFHATNDLFWPSTKLSLELRPKVMLWENVEELTEAKTSIIFGMMIGTLRRYAPDYIIEARVLNSWCYSDPTARPRAFIMAVHKSVGTPRWPDQSPLCQRKYIKDFLPTASYVVSTNFGEKAMFPHQPLCTITAHPNLQVMEVGAQELRRLTPRELLRGQGVGDDFIISGAITDQEKGIGNGMAIGVTRALARCIREILDEADGFTCDTVTPLMLPSHSDLVVTSDEVDRIHV